MILTGLGIWTAQFDFHPAGLVRDTVQELEELGYGSLWVGENVGRESISQSALLLASTQRLVVATAVANIYARDPLSAMAAQQTLSEAHPDRFILGLGVSHTKLVNDTRGLTYRAPLQTMDSYLDAMDESSTRYRAIRAATTTRMIGALGPGMLRLAGTKSDGAHTYLVTPEHTATARGVLGPDKLLVPEQAVVFETDGDRARSIARRHVKRYITLRNYGDNFIRSGFTPDDFAHGGSDHLIDALVAWGDDNAIANRLTQHRHAGADQVCVQVLDADFRGLPLEHWRRLAALGS